MPSLGLRLSNQSKTSPSRDGVNTALLYVMLRKNAIPTDSQQLSRETLKATVKEFSPIFPSASSFKAFCAWAQSFPIERIRQDFGGLPVFSPQAEYLGNSIGLLLLAEDTAKTTGAIFTPKWLASRITATGLSFWQKLNAGKRPKLAGDLSCGPGVFLEELAELCPSTTRIIGVDSQLDFVNLARILNFRRRNVEIHCHDTLLELNNTGQLGLLSAPPPLPPRGYDLIVGNPPYVRCQLLDADYSQKLRQHYPDLTTGNYDLVTLFLAHALDALAPGGVASLVVSSKFMSSKYGAEICRRIGRNARLLEIIDFGDGQVFGGRTTYACVITFAKLKPVGQCSILQFPPGLRWETDSHFASAKKAGIPCERFLSAPWDLTTSEYDAILELMRKKEFPLLVELFPVVAQGIRTGANNIFVVSDAVATEIEDDLLIPYVSGENIRRCKIRPSAKWLIWPYRFSSTGAVIPIEASELEHDFPKTSRYLRSAKRFLEARDLEPSVPWFCYSRSQNLDLAQRPKIISRELMPRAEFAADCAGKYALCSGYALIAPSRMSSEELQLWSAVLSTPTMEFQLRHSATQLHSGWFRVLKHHFNSVRLPQFAGAGLSSAHRITRQIIKDPESSLHWAALDEVVSRAFGITDEMRNQIDRYLKAHHAVSMPGSLPFREKEGNESSSPNGNGELKSSASGTWTAADDEEYQRRYIPVELPEYYRLHSEREDLRLAVTFRKNKSEPIHNWYNFTQGFSADLVRLLLKELGASSASNVYDPFAGSGTTLLVCREAGIPCFGAELSPFLCWITSLKMGTWDVTEVKNLIRKVVHAEPVPANRTDLLFSGFLKQAYSPGIFSQVLAWRDFFDTIPMPQRLRDFGLLALMSLLEEISEMRKHGSHYRFLNKPDSVGLAKLNIKVIHAETDIKPILLRRLNRMLADVEAAKFAEPIAPNEVFQLDSRKDIPPGKQASLVITSPPYLNRNMYLAQQKAELSLLKLVKSYDEYRKLINASFRSHVEGDLPSRVSSDIPEVEAIVGRIQLSENNNAKIPHMICGYFDDLRETLSTLRRILTPGARIAFVVGNSRWGGVVVPVDHLLALIAERLGYRADQIIVTRYKGNSPQQMRRYGKIPMRESIVLLRW